MFDEPEEDAEGKRANPADRAKDKADEFRMHAELAAVFEACRKFEAQIDPKLDPDIARDAQRTMGKLEKAKTEETGPLIPPPADADAAVLLDVPNSKGISTNDYHLYRRPGEVMIVRWIAGEQIESFYERLQAHFDAALEHFRTEERQSQEWKQDPQTIAYLDALDAITISMAEKYLREPIKQHGVSVVSTQSADELDILHLCDVIMGVPPYELVGNSAPSEDQPTEQERAWFFKLFSLRGVKDGEERMCFFAFMQKTDE